MGVQERSGLLNWATHLIHSTWTKSTHMEQHEVLCKLLAHEGYEVIFLPIVQGSARTLFHCLERATKELDMLSTQKDQLYSKLHLHGIHNLHKLVQLRLSLERSPETRGRIKGR